MLIKLGLFAITFLTAGAGTWFTLRYAVQRQLIDLPSARGSHQYPTPRGGGLAIVAVFLAGLLILFAAGLLAADLLIAISGGGLLVAATSFWDDHRPLPVHIRISVHFIAAGWALSWLGGMVPLDFGIVTWSWGPLRQLLGIIALVWLINLYNFMDGIDGIAAVEAIFTAAAGYLLLGGTADLSHILALLTACCAGFLVFNWTPARIFMGDVGSCFLGFVFGVLAIASSAYELLPIWCWVILLGVFLVDATVTLLRRILNGARWYDSHRSHAYQHAVRLLGNHARVTLAVLAINLCWLLPWALVAQTWPVWSFWLALLALLPLLMLALSLDAGRERPTPV